MADRTDGESEDEGAGWASPPYPSPPTEGPPAQRPSGAYPPPGPPGAYPPPAHPPPDPPGPAYPPPGPSYPPPGGSYPPPGPGYGQGPYGQGPYGQGPYGQGTGGAYGPGSYGGQYRYGYGGGQYGYGPPPTVPPEVYAGYWPRVGGWLIDALIVWVASYLVSIPLRSVHVWEFTIRTQTRSVTRVGHFSGLEAVAEVVIVLVYGALFCGSARGQTPGMMALGIRAVDRDTGGPIGILRALWRGVFEYILVIVLFVPWILDMLFPLWDGRRQTLHDKVSKTVVVKASLFPQPPRR
jgi:uncharacterized RDD family membrane protein YckC